MSRIKEALNYLRSTEQPESKRQKRRRAGANGSSADTATDIKLTNEEAGSHLWTFEVSGEIVPKHKISVDLLSLVEDGLLPREEDLQTINQQFRRIKRPILQVAFGLDSAVEQNSNVIMMASDLPGVGKSFCAVNLVRSIALERDVNAILVDADVLKSGISSRFGLEDRIGLIDYLINPDISVEDILVASDWSDVIIIPAGRKHPQATELLASHRMRELIALLSAQFERRAVVFDTPPLLVTSEAQVLSGQMGQIVLVIEAGVSLQETVAQALGLLDRSKPINAIMNKSKYAADGGYASDDYGYYPYPQGGFRDG